MTKDDEELARAPASAGPERGSVHAGQPAPARRGRRTVRATFRGTTVAESDRTVLVEGNHHFPPDNVRHELLTHRAAVTVCLWKGLARYRSIAIDGARLARGAWYYPRPLPWIRKIKDHVAFGPGVAITDRDP